METVDLVIYVIFITVVIWFSSKVWSNPEEFISRMRLIRNFMYKYSLGLLIPKWVKEYLDNNSNSEIVLARILFIFLYVLIIYIAAVSFFSTSSVLISK